MITKVSLLLLASSVGAGGISESTLKNNVSATLTAYYACYKKSFTRAMHDGHSQKENAEIAEFSCEAEFSEHAKAIRNLYLYNAEKAIQDTKNAAKELTLKSIHEN